MRAVLDTNVLISAFVSRTGAPAQILALWRSGEVEIVVSPESLAELERVLTYERMRRYLQYSDEQMARFLSLLRTRAELIQDVPAVAVVADDPDDDKFFALALAAEAAYIVSGDKSHVLPVGQYQGIRVVPPALFVHLVTQARSFRDPR
jgi:uncharacterized protein